MNPNPGYVLKISPPTAAVLVAGLQDWQERGLLQGATVALQIQQRQGEMDLTLSATTATQIPQLVQGLAAWAELNIITTPIQCKVTLPQLSEQLLVGLDQWLALGLLSDKGVRQFGQTYWCEPLAGTATPVTGGRMGGTPLATGTAYLLWALGFLGVCGLHRLYLGQVWPGLLWLFTLGLCGVGQLIDVFLIPNLTQAANRRRGLVPVAVTPAPARTPAPQPELLRSFRAELSVLWLALVGVFLVLLSSVVLAASVWDGLGTAGQYGLLWLYTLGFGAMALWLRSKNNVPLTALMLQGVTVILIPINFWTIDRLGLWSQGLPVLPLGAGLLLTGLGFWLQGRGAIPWGLGLVLLLPWLQSGWQYPAVIYSTVYGGSLLTTAVLSTALLGHGRRAQWPSLTWVGIFGGLGLLVVRAVFTPGVQYNDLALAIGLNGWLIVGLTRAQGIRIWGVVGWILTFLGWLMAIPVGLLPDGRWSWQAMVMVILLGELLVNRLRRTPEFPPLVGLFGLQLQALWLLWVAIPEAGRAQIRTWAEQGGGTLGMPTVLLSILWLPAVGLTLAARQWFQRQEAINLTRYSGILALALGSSLSVLSLANPTWRILVWGGCGWYLWAWVRSQISLPLGWIYLLQTLGLSTLLFAVERVAPQLPPGIWVLLLFTLAAGQWCWSCTDNFRGKTGWPVGLVLMGLGYWQWLEWLDGGNPTSWWVLSAFIPGIFLSILSWQPRCVAPRWWVGIALVSVVGSVVLLPGNLSIPGFLLGTGVAVVGAGRWPHGFPGMVALTLGFFLWEEILIETINGAWRTGMTTAFVLLVWAGRHYITHRLEPVKQIYAKICDWWAGIFSGAVLVYFTYIAYTKYQYIFEGITPEQVGVWAVGVVSLGLGYRLYQRVQPWAGYGLVWGLEVGLALGALLTSNPWLTLGLGNAGLGILALLILVWCRGLGTSLVGVPLFYGGVGALVGLGTPLTGVTGWMSLALGAIGLGVRRERARPLTYGSLAVITLGLYQFLVYQLLQLPAGKPGDGWMVLAALAVGLSYGYGGLSRWSVGRDWLNLTPEVVRRVGHGHWGLAVFLAAVRFNFPTSRNGVIGTAIILILCGVYALGYGRQRGAWVRGGLATLLAAWGDLLVLVVPETSLVNWAGTGASLLGVLLMSAPWERWGWADVRPWQSVGLLIPGVNVLLLAGIAGGNRVTWATLLVTAAFYAWSAKRDIRRSYVSLLLLDWGLLKFLREQGWQTFLIYGLIVGVSLLYIAQIDPYWQMDNTRKRRHFLRCVATGLIGVTAIWESQTAWVPGLLTMVLGLGLAGLGLRLRVRAYLFIGTLIFALQALIQTWIFITTYSILLWALGLGLGVMMLWVAATFETRRTQVMALMATFFQTGLASWE
ncbi:hypothetical protein GlitD10_0861 [Gloeomargarita lithophora Alchichica-D10]|uniref:TM2 domain-containing protein n=1 Tax=Gloeomargarita lithophora Alchichica-D10 TaxID=1188229 RepID=A0A1J0AB98_9CYAN|nr:NINE protein [Gloeomargarita lithophora]APB33177.1 hypothetical protein GlitD10_0861 [Gloeomargarita lithophora Alchichica-D10]